MVRRVQVSSATGAARRVPFWASEPVLQCSLIALTIAKNVPACRGVCRLRGLRDPSTRSVSECKFDSTEYFPHQCQSFCSRISLQSAPSVTSWRLAGFRCLGRRASASRRRKRARLVAVSGMRCCTAVPARTRAEGRCTTSQPTTRASGTRVDRLASSKRGVSMP